MPFVLDDSAHQRYESFVTNHKFRDKACDLGSADLLFGGTLVRVKRAFEKAHVLLRDFETSRFKI